MTVFFTVATVSYLPQAVTLLDSVKRYHPDFVFFIGLADYIDAESVKDYTLLKRYQVVQLHELNAPEFSFVTQNYTPGQLSNAIKVLFAEYFFKTTEASTIIYCDSDILFFSALPLNKFQEGNIIITPHFTTPPPLDYKIQELEVLNAGLYNGGCVILNRSQQADNFIQWLRDRSVLECVYDQARGIYGEQLWLNFLPLYFENVHIERHPGCNVAYWNLHERSISFNGDKFMINDKASLIFFHYSGWDYSRPNVISKWGRHTAEMRPDVLPLLQKYRKLLNQNGIEEYMNIPNFYYELVKARRKQEKTLSYKFKKLFKFKA